MQENPVKILLVEDNPAEARLLQELFRDVEASQFSFCCAKRLQEALSYVEAERFDVIFLDLTLPDSQGLESLNPLLKKVPYLPIVVLSNTDDDELAVEAVRQGAQDYLVKRYINREVLVRSLRYAIERKQTSEALQQAKEELEMRVLERTAELALANTALKQEICDRQQIEQALLQEKELAQITLHSIGDAVITTDAEGRIQSLNPVAQTLTGWSEEEARDRPLQKVLWLFDTATGSPIEDPITRVLNRGNTLEPSNRMLLRASDSQEFIIEYSAAPIRLECDRIVGAVLVCRDVTYSHNLASQLSWQASHDALTGLANRREFESNLQQILLEAKLGKQEHVLCYLDLDRFKIVNDTQGHAAGDQLLRQIADLLQAQLRSTDILARLGGDEFAILFPYCSLVKGQQLAARLIETIKAFRFNWRGKTFSVGASVGLVAIDRKVESGAKLLSWADAAMYAAKDRGGNRTYIYQNGDLDLEQRQGDMQWVSRIIKALEDDLFCLYAQPIADSRRENRFHYELLLRMKDDRGRAIAPGTFIAAAERYNLMPEIDRWVVRKLFSTLSAHFPRNPSDRGALSTWYAVNLSALSLNDEGFFEFLQQQFAQHQIPPEAICFEITETAAIANLSKAAKFIRKLKQLGCSFALDDFGSGMSSFTYLKNLPVDYLKIDGYFVKNLDSDPINVAMIEAINRIGHLMGLKTIAEFVENDAIRDKITAIGVDYVQGYGIAKPHPFELTLIPTMSSFNVA
ncbi:EAL domain-containing protein [Spirulina sp. 06S082]|uniref:EAL domain-containing protein n=1 Tax=Spirulina sp. 06S082 TaxID=3110248 RepID=UPI002B2119DE|nr:EAL domain-containing protein [Spirulina sp. 06S082]MEA5471066.1 EAL domain-containing protein [Spirulina sp. 06S082]